MTLHYIYLNSSPPFTCILSILILGKHPLGHIGIAKVYQYGLYTPQGIVVGDVSKALGYLLEVEAYGEADGSVIMTIAKLQQSSGASISKKYLNRAIEMGYAYYNSADPSEIRHLIEAERAGVNSPLLLRTIIVVLRERISARLELYDPIIKGAGHAVKLCHEYADKLISLGDWCGYITKYDLYIDGGQRLSPDVDLALNTFKEANRLGLVLEPWYHQVAVACWSVHVDNVLTLIFDIFSSPFMSLNLCTYL